jgi:hypothetical protein
VASAIGFIALAGMAAEFGVVMLIYLKQALEQRVANGAPRTAETLLEAIDEGAVQRVRPKAMTVGVILAGLAPIMWSGGRRGGNHAADRGTHDRRDDHRAAPVDVRYPGGVFADSPPGIPARARAARTCGRPGR